MEHGFGAIDHREYEELLAVAALGALTPEEHAVLAEHLRGCQACRAAYGRLVSAADALPLVVEERAPSAGLRDRLQAQVEADLRERRWSGPSSTDGEGLGATLVPLPGPTDSASARDDRRGNLRWLDKGKWILAAAAVLLLGLLGGVAIDRLVLDEDDDPAPVQTIALDYPGDVQSDVGTLTYLPEQNVLHFHAPDLPEPPADHVYQAWLIDDAGPRPVGVVDPETGEFVTTVDLERDDTFAVTVEPAPLGSPGPTTDPVIVAPLEGQSAT